METSIGNAHRRQFRNSIVEGRRPQGNRVEILLRPTLSSKKAGLARDRATPVREITDLASRERYLPRDFHQVNADIFGDEIAAVSATSCVDKAHLS